MILYFSGTGNTEYTAKRIGKEIQDETLDLFEKIRNRDFSDMTSDSPWVIAAPTYSWRIPRVLQEWLSKTRLNGNKNIYFVMTCAGSIGNAGAWLKNLCSSKGLNYMGCIPVIMPENYIALFHSPTQEEALKIIDQSEKKIDEISFIIKNKEIYATPPITFKDKVNSGIVNDLFYPLFVHARKFHTTDACISCGKCTKVCPLKNIHLEKGKPVWSSHCTHCMACINRCPAEAIEYGKHSKGLIRYTCPKRI